MRILILSEFIIVHRHDECHFVLGNGPAPRRTSLNNTGWQNRAKGASLRTYWIERVRYGSPKPTVDQQQQEQHPPPSYESALRKMNDEQQQLPFGLPIDSTLPGTLTCTPAEDEGAGFSQEDAEAVTNATAPMVPE